MNRIFHLVSLEHKASYFHEDRCETLAEAAQRFAERLHLIGYSYGSLKRECFFAVEGYVEDREAGTFERIEQHTFYMYEDGIEDDQRVIRVVDRTYRGE